MFQAVQRKIRITLLVGPRRRHPRSAAARGGRRPGQSAPRPLRSGDRTWNQALGWHAGSL